MYLQSPIMIKYSDYSSAKSLQMIMYCLTKRDFTIHITKLYGLIDLCLSAVIILNCDKQ